MNQDDCLEQCVPQIETLPGAENLGQIDDLDYFRRKLIAPLMIPNMATFILTIKPKVGGKIDAGVIARALRDAADNVVNGTTAYENDLEVTEFHQGDSDVSHYTVAWQIAKKPLS